MAEVELVVWGLENLPERLPGSGVLARKVSQGGRFRAWFLPCKLFSLDQN